MREIKRIVLHHSGTSARATVEGIRNHHVNAMGWRDIGYHYVIQADGLLRLGRPEWMIGAHVKGYNLSSIGICLIGNYEDNELPVIYTDSSGWDVTLSTLLEDLLYRYPKAAVVGHNDLAPTLCPGKHLTDWLENWRY